ncbi:hypothetical protein FQN60_014696, partial [Etheostoma spectabile]
SASSVLERTAAEWVYLNRSTSSDTQLTVTPEGERATKWEKGQGRSMKDDMLMIFVFLLLLFLSSPPVSSSPLAKQCDVTERWVCGSNSRSYRNHCELHRDACITQTKIHLEHRGHCLVVCFLSDRDWLRERVIQWIQEEIETDNMTSNDSANHLLQTYFETYDNGDSELDSKEFLSFLKHNETALNLTSLCVDALIELSDENADWKLSLTEFINCLTPTYHPYERREHQVEQDVKEGAEEEELTEEEWSRRVAELNA